MGSSGDGGALADGGDAGGTTTGPQRGGYGESCQTSSDCQSPFACIGGKCSAVSYMLTATGKTCSAECNPANNGADCCEMPPLFAGSFDAWALANPADGGLDFHPGLFATNLHCDDLLTYFGGNAAVCKGTSVATSTTLALACSYYASYCSCSASTWTCTNQHCAYTAPCVAQVSNETTQQCPPQTRSGTILSTTCNVPASSTTGTCTPPGCAQDSDCAGQRPFHGTSTCSPGDAGTASDCICHSSTCYFACKKDIDCGTGYTCEAATHLCKVASCTADAQCVLLEGTPLAKCASGQCIHTCTRDIDCSPPTTICSMGACLPSGCSTDADCVFQPGSVQLFCATAPPTIYTSAITN
jgi:hypothetical protein